MKVIRLLVIVGLVIVVGMQLRVCFRRPMTQMPAPELSASRWFNGEAVQMQSLRGKLVLLDFWAVW
ncbi:MAG: hypothetical protein WHX60_05935 [Armatimonadota bacterium]